MKLLTWLQNLFFGFTAKSTQENLDRFEKRFPGRCPICSLHRYGVREGHIKYDQPVDAHVCEERMRSAEVGDVIPTHLFIASDFSRVSVPVHVSDPRFVQPAHDEDGKPSVADEYERMEFRNIEFERVDDGWKRVR